MKFSKKIISFTLCTALLSGVSLVALANVAHADSNNGICARNVQARWVETINLKLKRKTSPLEKSYLKLNLVGYSDRVRLEYNGYVPSLYDYVFDDEYLFGSVSTHSCTNFKMVLNNNGIGPFQNGNIAQKIDKLINGFNNANIQDNDFIYMHGVGYNDTMTFSGDKILVRGSNKSYSNGYKSRGIDKWKNGFQVSESGLYECALINNK